MPAGVAETQNTDMIKCWQGWRTTGTLTHCWWECRVARPLSKAVQWFPSQLSILLTYDPGIMLLGIYSNELKTYVQYKNYLPLNKKKWLMAIWEKLCFNTQNTIKYFY